MIKHRVAVDKGVARECIDEILQELLIGMAPIKLVCPVPGCVLGSDAEFAFAIQSSPGSGGAAAVNGYWWGWA